MRFLLVLLALTACEPNIDSRGHVRDMDGLADILPATSTREQVLERYGSPSTVSSFGQETWYYITAKKESFAFFAPEIVEQDVVRIVFDQRGVVTSVDKFDKAAMKDIALAEKITPTDGQELTPLEQLLGNVGRFNAPGTTGAQGSGPRGRR